MTWNLDMYARIPLAWRPRLMVADGMGVDSTAMLIHLHRIGLRPDAILHADTGDEKPETVAYRDTRRAWLATVGFPELTIVRRAQSIGVNGQPYTTLREKCLTNATLPGIAFGRKSCSEEWKIEPQNRWTARWAPAVRGWGRGQRVVKLIGYDAGPIDDRRAHHLVGDHRYVYIYPLRDLGWTRERCIFEIGVEGVPLPYKSACYYCSASKTWEIARIVRDHPALADNIIGMERAASPNLRAIDGLWRTPIKGARAAAFRVRAT